jgi:hypothetical protein
MSCSSLRWVISNRFSTSSAMVFVDQLQEARAEWRRRHLRELRSVPPVPTIFIDSFFNKIIMQHSFETYWTLR